MHSANRNILWCALGVAALLAILLCGLSSLSLAADSILWAVAMATGALVCLLRPPHTFSTQAGLVRFLEGAVILVISGTLGAVLTYVSMRHSSGFSDALLDRADDALGFRWPAARAAAEAWPAILHVLEMAYSSFAWMPLLILFLLSRSDRPERIYLFLTAYGLALAVTVVIFHFFPARAAFAHYWPTGSAFPANAESYGRAIANLRSGAPGPINLLELEGIVTFPSFHGTMAILYVWAAWREAGWLRIPLVAINGLMWLAAVPVGGHYMVDLLGGSIVALGGIAMAHQLFGDRRASAMPRFRRIIAQDGVPEMGLAGASAGTQVART